MKTDRFSSASPRAVAALLAGLLLAAGLPAAGQITLSFKKKASVNVAAALARQVAEVRKGFDKNRRALRTVPGPGGEAVYPREEVAGLIARTEADLDQAIERVGEPGLDGLRAWSAEEFRRLQGELAAPFGQTASLPRAVARVASLGGPESVGAATSQQASIAAEKSDRLLDQAGEVIGRIFFLADRDDLEVELWVGSTPAPKVTFSFWSQGKIRGAAPAPTLVQTNGKRGHVLRGLYSYKAAWAKGAVTELVAYPNPAGAPVASERLDLVNGSSFFCCRFNEQYCQHVASEKECRP
jgi:hypothetical protein